MDLPGVAARLLLLIMGSRTRSLAHGVEFLDGLPRTGKVLKRELRKVRADKQPASARACADG